jgi:hypothetical protein
MRSDETNEKTQRYYFQAIKRIDLIKTGKKVEVFPLGYMLANFFLLYYDIYESAYFTVLNLIWINFLKKNNKKSDRKKCLLFSYRFF